jgi:hypothetical protein
MVTKLPVPRMFGVHCVRCGNELIAPENTEYVDHQFIRHRWHCPKCRARFESFPRFPPTATRVKDLPSQIDVFPRYNRNFTFDGVPTINSVGERRYSQGAEAVFGSPPSRLGNRRAHAAPNVTARHLVGVPTSHPMGIGTGTTLWPQVQVAAGLAIKNQKNYFIQRRSSQCVEKTAVREAMPLRRERVSPRTRTTLRVSAAICFERRPRSA